MVAAVICMSLRRYVLKICFKVSEYTESLIFDGKCLSFFGNMYRAIYRAAGWLIFSRTGKYVPSYHDITDITSLSIFAVFFVIRTAVSSRKLYICTETSFSSISLIELMYLHFPNFFVLKGQ